MYTYSNCTPSGKFFTLAISAGDLIRYGSAITKRFVMSELNCVATTLEIKL